MNLKKKDLYGFHWSSRATNYFHKFSISSRIPSECNGTYRPSYSHLRMFCSRLSSAGHSTRCVGLRRDGRRVHTYSFMTSKSSQVDNLNNDLFYFDSSGWGTGGQSGYRRAPVCADGSQIIYAWALDAPPLELPKGVGFKVGGDSNVNFLVLQVTISHSFNHNLIRLLSLLLLLIILILLFLILGTLCRCIFVREWAHGPVRHFTRNGWRLFGSREAPCRCLPSWDRRNASSKEREYVFLFSRTYIERGYVLSIQFANYLLIDDKFVWY